MNTTHLKYALEVEKTGSISKAAQNLFISQPNLSKAIRVLEEEAGFTLFSRSSRGMVVTELGKAFLAHARVIMTELAQINRLGNRDRLPDALKYCLVLPKDMGCEALVARFAAELAMLNPGRRLALSFRELNAVAAISDLTEDGCELAVIRYKTEHEAFFAHYLQEKRLSCCLLRRFECRLLISSDHPLATAQHIGKSDLAACPEILIGDTIIPYLSTAPYSDADRPADLTVQAEERSTLFALLATLPRAYMWSGPFPAETLAAAGLVLKTVEDQRPLYQDCAVWPAARGLSREDDLILSILKRTFGV